MPPRKLQKSIAEVSSEVSGGDRRLFRWNSLRATLDTAIDNDRITTEEAFALLVRLGQLSAGGVKLETFARRARELVRRSSERLPADRVGHPSTAALNVLDGDTSSVFLWPKDIASLTAELDPLRKVDSAFDELRKKVGERQSTSRHLLCSYRSPLHGYAIARRYHRWREHLAAIGSCLTVAKLKVGRRCQDLLLADSEHRIDSPFSVSSPAPTVTAVELITEAKALMAKVTRRQTAAGRSDDGHFHAMLTARVNMYAPLPDRSTKEMQYYDGWGCYEQAALQQRDNGALPGEPVAVLEISPEQARKTVNALQGGTASFGDNMAFIASLLSVPALRGQPGLLNFHLGAKILPDKKGTPSGGGDGDSAAGGSSVNIVCERLQGWKSLREVINEHGPLVSLTGTDAVEGLRVLRLFGSQLAVLLEGLRSRSLVLRDLRASAIFVSPNGRNIKVVDFSSLATLEPMGTVSPNAASLDPDVHGPTRPSTPPEGLSSTGDLSPSAGSKKAPKLSLYVNRDVPLVLADGNRPGVFPATAAWDIWTLGVLLFELAFGHPPPAYGMVLGQAVTSSTDPVVATAGVPAPMLEELARSVQYDFLSSIGKNIAQKNKKSGHISSTDFETVPTLENVSVGTAIGISSLCSARNIGIPPQGAFDVQDSLAEQSKRIVESFQRAWVKEQLRKEERGDVELPTWQDFQEKIKRHLEVSIAVAPPLLERLDFPFSLNRESKRPSVTDIDISEAAVYKGTVASAINRIMVRLRETDAREHGWLPFRIVQRILSNELQMSLLKSEAELLAVCLKEGAPSGRNSDNSIENSHNVVEDAVFYSILEYVLRASVSGSDEAQASRLRAKAPTLTVESFIEVLRVCLEPDPVRRLSPSDLLRLPFFSASGCDIRDREELDHAAASAYLAGSDYGESSLLLLREKVLRPVQAIEDAVLGFPASATINGSRKTIMDPPAGTRTGSTPATGALMKALKNLQRLVNRGFVPDESSSRARRAVRSHTGIIDAIFDSGVLVRVSAIALRLLEEDEVRIEVSGFATFMQRNDP